MAWYDEAIFYHIYPLGITGAPKQNAYTEPEYRLNKLLPFIKIICEHIKCREVIMTFRVACQDKINKESMLFAWEVFLWKKLLLVV